VTIRPGSMVSCTPVRDDLLVEELAKEGGVLSLVSNVLNRCTGFGKDIKDRSESGHVQNLPGILADRRKGKPAVPAFHLFFQCREDPDPAAAQVR